MYPISSSPMLYPMDYFSITACAVAKKPAWGDLHLYNGKAPNKI